jgi:2-oxoglutarate dehydrogenase E1 component
LNKYPNAELFYVQEEHLNQGCWGYVEPRIRSMLKKYELKNKEEVTYVGRRACSASSAGWADLHEKELKEFLAAAFD